MSDTTRQVASKANTARTDLPTWLRAVCSRAFLEAYEAGETIDFSCYEPAFLTHTTQHTGTSNSNDTALSVRHFFPALLPLVLSENMAEAASLSTTELRQRRAAAHMDWERVTPIEEIWRGPALSSKVPPAVDYERLLLDGDDAHSRLQ